MPLPLSLSLSMYTANCILFQVAKTEDFICAMTKEKIREILGFYYSVYLLYWFNSTKVQNLTQKLCQSRI